MIVRKSYLTNHPFFVIDIAVKVFDLFHLLRLFYCRKFNLVVVIEELTELTLNHQNM